MRANEGASRCPVIKEAFGLSGASVTPKHRSSTRAGVFAHGAVRAVNEGALPSPARKAMFGAGVLGGVTVAGPGRGEPSNLGVETAGAMVDASLDGLGPFGLRAEGHDESNSVEDV